MSRLSLGDVKSKLVANITTETEMIADPGDGFKAVIVGLALTLDADGAITITDGTTDMFTTMELLADHPLVLPLSALGWYTATASANVTLTATTACNGTIRYVVVSDD